jgi:hypothetical protein
VQQRTDRLHGLDAQADQRTVGAQDLYLGGGVPGDEALDETGMDILTEDCSSADRFIDRRRRHQPRCGRGHHRLRVLAQREPKAVRVVHRQIQRGAGASTGIACAPTLCCERKSNRMLHDGGDGCADVTRRDGIAHEPVWQGVPHVMVGGQYDASPTSRVDQLIGLSAFECQQFLTQDVLARSDGSQRVPVVRGVDARNVDGTDARVGERSIEVVVAVGAEHRR